MSKAQELADQLEALDKGLLTSMWAREGDKEVVAELRRLDRVNAVLVEALNSTNSALEKIGNYAHDRSTGPAVWDPLWEIRSMAYDNVFCVDAALSSSGDAS